MRVKLFFILTGVLSLFISAHGAAPGDLDPTFGTTGKVVGTIPGTGGARDVALQADGKIVLASTVPDSSSRQDFAVIRLNSDGTTDTSFGNGGFTRVFFDNFANEFATAVVVQPDGKIIVAGNAEFGSPGYDFAVARLNSDGSLDASFGSGGKIKVPVSTTEDYLSDMILQPDGKIILVGKGRDQPHFDAAVVRLNSNGTFDHTFNGSGKIVIPIGAGASNDFFSAVTLQTDGKIIAAGGASDDFAVLRFNPNGSLDTTFDGDGKSITPVGTQYDEALTVALQPDGKIVAGGSANSGSGNEAALVRYNPNGSLDTGFDGDGKLSLRVSQFNSEVLQSIAIDPNGKIVGVAAGLITREFVLLRFNSNGSPDSGFGNAGKVFARISDGDSAAVKVLLQPDEKILAAGGVSGSTPGFAVARFLSSANATRKKTVGVFRPSNGITYLRNSNTGGFADVSMIYGVAGDTSFAGDWNGDGVDSLGIYRNGVFYLRNSNTTGPADVVIAFGSAGDQPIAGDWNGDGIDTIGVYRPSTGVFMLRNSNSAGAPDIMFVLGNPGDVAIAGDWNGDGITTTGVFRPTNGIVYLKNANTSGNADIYLVYGVAGDKPLAGDWDGDGLDSIGIYRDGVFYLRNSNTQGNADIVFALGNPGDEPVAGDWDGLP